MPGFGLAVYFVVGRGAAGFRVSDASFVAPEGWKHAGERLIVAGELIEVAGGPLSQVTKGRLLRCTSRPSVKLACSASTPGSWLSL